MPRRSLGASEITVPAVGFKPPGALRVPMPRGRDREAHPAGSEGQVRAQADRRQRAREEALTVRERGERPYRSFEVRNPVHGTRYLVLAPDSGGETLLLCPCPDFGRRDVGTCKHVEAVRLHLAQPEGPVPAGVDRTRSDRTEPVWLKIEEALQDLGPVPPADLRPLSRIGRLLIESELAAPGPVRRTSLRPPGGRGDPPEGDRRPLAADPIRRCSCPGPP